jgi:hypothetical protein
MQFFKCRSRGRDRMVVGYNWIQHYVIKFVNDLRQVGGFLRVLRFPSPVNLTSTIKLKYC